MTEYQLKQLLQMKEKIIQKVEKKHMKVKEGAEILGITRQGFLKLRKNYRKHGSKAVTGSKRGPKSWHRPYNRTPLEIEVKVIEYAQQNYLEGPKTLEWKMAEEIGVKLHHQTIYRILKREGVIEDRKKLSKRDWKEVETNYPGERVQIDTCFPWGRTGPCVIEAIDNYSRWAYGQVFEKYSMANAAKFAEMFVRRAPFKVELFQADNGPEFKRDFVEKLDQLGVKFETIPPYSPNCNGRVERMHKTTKERLYNPMPFKLPTEERNYLANQYFDYYNFKRRHQGKGMNMKTPMQMIHSYVLKNYLLNGNLTVIHYIS